MKKNTIAGIFKLLERINMKFPNGQASPSDKVRFIEHVNVVITSSDGRVTKRT
jgi:hypothetical protein